MVLSVRFRAYMHDVVSVRERDVGEASSFFYIFVVECFTVVAISFPNSVSKAHTQSDPRLMKINNIYSYIYMCVFTANIYI